MQAQSTSLQKYLGRKNSGHMRLRDKMRLCELILSLLPMTWCQEVLLDKCEPFLVISMAQR